MARPEVLGDLDFTWLSVWQNWFRHGLVHHFLAEERWTIKFVAAAKLFIDLSRQFLMGRGIGVKWHRDDCIFNWSIHAFGNSS